MIKTLLLAGATAAAMFSATAASAVDVTFSFDDGFTSFFYDRAHLPGTSVSGVLYGLADNATTLVSQVGFTSVDPGLGLVGSVFTGGQWGGTGITLVNGGVTAANVEFNFNDDVGNGFQLRLNGSEVPGANWLFWNGGTSPVVGTGNTAGLDGVTFGDTGGVPEPASWALMITGFGLVGAAMRRRNLATA
jgi:PEP-CTERM motif